MTGNLPGSVDLHNLKALDDLHRTIAASLFSQLPLSGNISMQTEKLPASLFDSWRFAATDAASGQ